MRELEALLQSLNEDMDYLQQERDEVDGPLRNYMTGKVAGLYRAIVLVENHIRHKNANKKDLLGWYGQRQVR